MASPHEIETRERLTSSRLAADPTVHALSCVLYPRKGSLPEGCDVRVAGTCRIGCRGARPCRVRGARRDLL